MKIFKVKQKSGIPNQQKREAIIRCLIYYLEEDASALVKEFQVSVTVFMIFNSVVFHVLTKSIMDDYRVAAVHFVWFGCFLAQTLMNPFNHYKKKKVC